MFAQWYGCCIGEPSYCVSYLENFDVENIWQKLGGKNFVPNKSSATEIKDIIHHMLCKWLAQRLTARTDGHHLVSKRDMVYLYSMIHGNPLHTGWGIMEHLAHMGKRYRGAPFGRAFMTNLAKSYKVSLKGLTKVRDVGMLTRETRYKMNLTTSREGAQVLIKEP